jgi:cellobiose epimerase
MNPRQMNQMDLLKIKQSLETELTTILRFWSATALDNEKGGFYGSVDHVGIPDPQADKGIILNTRILWTFSKAYNHTLNPEYLEMAQRAYLYIQEHFLDKRFGGYYWKLDCMGKPKERKKQIYAQAFMLYALSEFYQHDKSGVVLQQAVSLFNLMEKHSLDTVKEGYLEAFDEAWNPMDDVRLSEKDENLIKTMNTHLHVLEAYTSFYSIWKDASLGMSLENLLGIFMEKIYNPLNHHLELFFDEDWVSQSKKVSYGHEIESSWLLWEAAEVIGNTEMKSKCKEIALHLVHASMEGLDTDGGLMNELDNQSGHLDSDKHWWPQAEAMVGFFNAYELTHDKKYLELFKSSYQFTEQYIIDKKVGEWHGRLNRDRKPYPEEKAGFWKCPYHNGRACIEIIQRINAIHNEQTRI